MTDNHSPLLRLDDEGLPILDEVVEEPPSGTPQERLKNQLLDELEPQIQSLVRTAFIKSVKMVALEMKRSFEQELDEKLRERLDELVERAVAEAFEQTRG